MVEMICIGGSYVEGGWLRNAFHWKVSVGPWEERPGHFNDIWQYWTDDGLGLFEFLQVCNTFIGFYLHSSLRIGQLFRSSSNFMIHSFFHSLQRT